MLSNILRKTARQFPEFISVVRSTLFPGTNYRTALEFQVAGIPSLQSSFPGLLHETQEPTNVFDVAILNMAVPKSKVSPSRKRMKHLQHVPDKVQWYTCTRCGEPKRPHRICTKHLDICALRDEDWDAIKSKKATAEASAPTGDAK